MKDRERYNQLQKEYRERSPEKVKARKVVFVFLRSGELKRLPCELCGNPKSEAHHEDYKKPLKIQWLCKLHHVWADKLLKYKKKLSTPRR